MPCGFGRPTRPTNPRRAFNDDEFLLPEYPYLPRSRQFGN
jgi:hypothetical protein